MFSKRTGPKRHIILPCRARYDPLQCWKTSLVLILLQDFRIFQILTTYQYPCFKRTSRPWVSLRAIHLRIIRLTYERYSLKFTKCILRPPGKVIMGVKPREYGPGAAQILYRLSGSEYRTYQQRETESLKQTREADFKRSTSGQSRPSMTSLEHQYTNMSLAGTALPASSKNDLRSKSGSKYRLVLYARAPSVQGSSKGGSCIVINGQLSTRLIRLGLC